jgi:hypothetical protein
VEPVVPWVPVAPCKDKALFFPTIPVGSTTNIVDCVDIGTPANLTAAFADKVPVIDTLLLNPASPVNAEEPVTIKLPVTLCVSSNVSPNLVEPLWNMIEDDTYVVKTSLAVSLPDIFALPVTVKVDPSNCKFASPLNGVAPPVAVTK